MTRWPDHPISNLQLAVADQSNAVLLDHSAGSRRREELELHDARFFESCGGGGEVAIVLSRRGYELPSPVRHRMKQAGEQFAIEKTGGRDANCAIRRAKSVTTHDASKLPLPGTQQRDLK